MLAEFEKIDSFINYFKDVIIICLNRLVVFFYVVRKISEIRISIESQNYIRLFIPFSQYVHGKFQKFIPCFLRFSVHQWIDMINECVSKILKNTRFHLEVQKRTIFLPWNIDRQNQGGRSLFLFLPKYSSVLQDHLVFLSSLVWRLTVLSTDPEILDCPSIHEVKVLWRGINWYTSDGLGKIWKEQIFEKS